MNGKTRSPSPPTERVIAVVELLAARASPAGAAEIADELTLNRSTVLAILTALAERGWVSRAPDLRYRPGQRLAALVANTRAALTAPANTDQVLHELAGKVGCGAALSLVSATELAFVSVVAGRGRVPAGITPDTVLPLRAPAGAAVVAFRTDHEQHQWLATAEKKHRDRLAEALELIRTRGVAAWGIDAADPTELDLLAEVVEHLADHPAPHRLRERVFALLANISGRPYTAANHSAETTLPLSYLVAPVFDDAGIARWELQLGPLREAVDRTERDSYTAALRQAARDLSATPPTEQRRGQPQ